MIFEIVFEGKMDSRIFHAAILTITTACFMLRYKNVGLRVVGTIGQRPGLPLIGIFNESSTLLRHSN